MTRTNLSHCLSAAALAALLVFTGCNGCNSAPNNNAAADPNGPDPAMANLAAGSTGQTGAVLGQSDAMQPQQSGEAMTPQQGSGAPVADDYNATDNSYDQSGADSETAVTADQAPPPLPEYDQPPAPDPNYLWTPGYWAWGDSGYYWVPGEWCPPPYYGALWTPPYWGYYGNHYMFHRGYWGPHVGFYGGVNYGFGYVGVGFAGGRWAGNSFAYNTSVVNVNTTVIHNTYNQTVINNVTVNKVSFNGGAGGVQAAPTPQERIAAQETHTPPTAMQTQHVQEAVRNPALAAKANGGHPSIAATARPASFSGPGVTGARGASSPPPRGPAAAGGGAPNNASRPNGQPNGAQHPPAGNPAANKPKAPPKKAPPKEQKHDNEH